MGQCVETFCSWDGLSRGQAAPWHRNPSPQSAVPRLGDPSARTESGAQDRCPGSPRRGRVSVRGSTCVGASFFFLSLCGAQSQEPRQLVAPLAEPEANPPSHCRASGRLARCPLILVSPEQGRRPWSVGTRVPGSLRTNGDLSGSVSLSLGGAAGSSPGPGLLPAPMPRL